MDDGLLRPLDLSPIQVSHFQVDDHSVQVAPPLRLLVEYDQETAMLTVEEPPLGIDAFGETRETLEASLQDEFETLWRYYATAPDDALAPDGLALKRRLIERFRLAEDAAQA